MMHHNMAMRTHDTLQAAQHCLPVSTYPVCTEVQPYHILRDITPVDLLVLAHQRSRENIYGFLWTPREVLPFGIISHNAPTLFGDYLPSLAIKKYESGDTRYLEEAAQFGLRSYESIECMKEYNKKIINIF